MKPESTDPPTAIESDRRIVTILFADLVGFTSWCERLDPEHVTDRLNACFQVLSQPIYAYGGTLDKYMGDALMALFGAPLAHEDDPARALAAALEMQNQARLFAESTLNSFPLQLRIGLNTGLVVAGSVGDDHHRSYTVIGDAVNLAQRLESAAEPGSILVGPETYRQARRLFDFRSLPPLMVKGKREAITAYELLGKQETEHPSVLPRLAIGREAELKQLMEIWDRVKEGQPRWLTLCGEAGIGKSHLVEVFIAQTSPSHCLRLRCPSFHQSQPLTLLQESLREHLGLSLSEEILPALVSKLRREPILLIFEDLQWADQTTWEWLQRLSLQLRTKRLPLLVLAMSRHPAGPFPFLRLDPLSPAMARQLLQGLDSQGLSASDRKKILSRADGNPLILRELVRAVHEGMSADSELPGSIKRLVAARLDRLSSPARTLLEAAAVAGRTVTIRLLEELAGVPDFERHLETLVTQDWLRLQDGEVTFTQAISHEVTYQRLLLRKRRELHARMAAILQRRHGPDVRFASIIAHHFLEANELNSACGFLKKASEHACGIQAYRDAHSYLQKAIQIATQEGKEWGDWWKALAELETALGDFDSAQRSIETALRLSQPSDDRTELLRALAQILEKRGSFQEAMSLLEEAQAASGDRLRSARLGIDRGWLLLRMGCAVEAEEACQEALDHLSETENAEQARALSILGILAYRQNQWKKASQLHRRALVLREACHDRPGLAASLNNLGMIAVECGDWPQAKRWYQQSLHHYRELGSTSHVATLYNNLGDLYLRQGRPSRARRRHRAALELRTRLGDRFGIAASHGALGETLRQEGQLDAARKHLLQSLQGLEEIGETELLAEVCQSLGQVELASRDWNTANRWFKRALQEALRAKDFLRVASLHRSEAQLALAQGQIPLARQKLRACQAQLARRDAPLETAKALELEFELLQREGRSHEAALCLGRAQAIFIRLGIAVPSPSFPPARANLFG